jgi:nucleotide-binding universal stress UspA family protein
VATENRVVRPFSVPVAAQSWLEENVHVAIDFLDGDGDSIIVLAGETKRPDAASFMRSRVTMSLNQDARITELQESLKSYARGLGEGGEDLLVFVLYGTTSYLSFTEELGRWTLREFAVKLADPHLIADGSRSRPRVLSTPHHGCVLDLVVMLWSDIPSRPLLPYRRGTWLARARFVIGNTTEGLGFRPIPLTPELRQELGLAAETVRFARLNPYNGQVLESETFDDFLEFYVDAALLQSLSATPRAAHSVHLQTDIFLTALQFVVLEAIRSGDLDGKVIDDLGETLVKRLIRATSSESDDEMNRWLSVLQTDPFGFLAKWEEIAQYRSCVHRLLGSVS